MKSILKVITSVLLVSAASIGYASDFRIGVVDTERILRESVPAVQAEKKIEKEFEQRDLEMKKVAKQAKDIQLDFDKQGMTLMDAEHRSKERELANLNVNLQRMQREFREDLNLRKNEELALVLERANKAIKAIAESEKYDLAPREVKEAKTLFSLLVYFNNGLFSNLPQKEMYYKGLPI